MKVSSGSNNHNKSGSHHNQNNGRSNNNNHDDAATTLQYWKTKMGHNNSTTTETTNSEIWLTAISTAEHRRRNDARDAAGYLGHLKQLLQRHNDGSSSRNNRMAPQWNNPPTFYPPPPRWDRGLDRGLVRNIEQRHAQNDGYGTQNNINDEDALVDEIASSMMPQLTVSTPTRSSTTNQNQYSVFDDGNDDEHDDDSDNEIEGEEIVYNTPRMQQQQRRRGNNNNNRSNNREDTSSYHQYNNNNQYHHADDESSKNMSMRRILLRIYCSLAEIHSSYALECSRSHPTQWIEGADEFQIAYNILRSGQEIIDEEHALLMQVVETISLLSMDGSSSTAARLELEKVVNERQIGLSDDSRVVSVPLAYFTTSRDKYIAAAQSRIATLEDKLYQDWTTRQEIMNKMGDRWKNNPRPNYSHYEARKRMEKELDDCLEGVNRTRMMEVGVGRVEMM